MRYAHTRHDPCRADGTGADPDLDRIGARPNQRPCRLGSCHVAGNHLHPVRQLLYPLDRLGHTFAVTMRGVDHHHVNARINQRLAAFKARIADGRGRSHAQPALIVLAGMWVQHGLFGILQREQSGQLALPVRHQQFLDPPRLHQAFRGLQIGWLLQQGKVVRGHHHPHRRLVIGRKAHVAVGHDTDDAASLVHHRKAGDIVALLQRLGVCERLVRAKRDRIVDDAAFKPLHAADFGGLLQKSEIAVNDADATGLRHGNRHPRLGHRVHRRRQERDVHADRLRHKGRCIGVRWQHARGGRNQKHVVKGESLTNLHGNLLAGDYVWRFPLSRVRPKRKGKSATGARGLRNAAPLALAGPAWSICARTEGSPRECALR